MSPRRIAIAASTTAFLILGSAGFGLAQTVGVTGAVNPNATGTPPGSTVRVTCRRLRNQVEIFVDDVGPGVRPDVFDKIFERFYTDRPHQGFGQNSGLGLSISKQIVEAHGGTIWVENRTGAAGADGTPTVLGARFIVRLPAM